MKSHPAWLEHWVDLVVDLAEYDRERKQAEITFTKCGSAPLLRMGIRNRNFMAYFNEEIIEGKFAEEGKWEITPSGSGVLVLKFL